MKRLLALVLALCLSLSLLPGCSTDDYAKYVAAVEKTNKLEALQGQMKMLVGIKTQGLSMEIPLTLDFKQRIDDGELTLYQKQSMEFLGYKQEIEQYYVDGVYYVSEDGYKYKVEQSLEDIDELLSPSVLNFEKGDLVSSSGEKVDKGTKYTATISGSAIETYLYDVLNMPLDELLDGMAGLEDVEIDIPDTTVYFIIDKAGYICEYSMILEFSVTVDEATVSCSLDFTMSLFDLGKDVTIDFPDFSEYEGYSWLWL